MVNLADLPNAGPLSGSETLPMQQGAGAVKVTVNSLFSRAAGQVIPVEIGGTRIVTITGTGVGIGTTSPEKGIHVQGSSDSAACVRVRSVGTGIEPSFELHSPSGHVFAIKGISGGGVEFYQNGVASRGRFDGSGNFMVGQSAVNISSANTYPGVSISPVGFIKVTRNENCMMLHRTEGVGSIMGFAQGVSNIVGSISVTASSTAYNTTSDYRLPWKKGHVPLTGSGEFIDALNPRFFPEVGHAGFIAHQVAEVSPSSVTGEKDAVDEKGNPKYQQMDASSPDIMANIIAELQSLRRRVAALEAAT